MNRDPSTPADRVLSSRERQTLTAIADTFVGPDMSEGAGVGRPSASDAQVDLALVRILEEYLSNEEAKQLRRLLWIADHRLGQLILGGAPRRITRMAPRAREAMLLEWADSRVELKRRAFRALKRLVLFLYYAPPNPSEGAERWSAIGYTPVDSPVGLAQPSPDLGPTVVPPSSGTIDCDVCIVGSGAGGSVAAARTAAAGYRVLVLEAGPPPPGEALPCREGPAFDAVFHSHGLLGTSDSAFSVLAGRTVGGSTAINWMTCLRPPPFVRREWEDRGMAGVAGPLFDAVLDRVEQRLSVGRDESWVNPNNASLARGCRALGLEEGTDFEIISRNARGCDRRCQPCVFGCPYGAKQSAAATYLTDARRAGARLMTHARAVRLETRGGRIGLLHVRYEGFGGPKELTVRAAAIVLAGGAIESPALLLRSGWRDPVGRGLRLHPTSAILALHHEPVRMWSGPMQTVVVRRFQRSDPELHGPWIEASPAHPGLAAQAAPWRGSEAHRQLMHRLERASASIALVRDRAAGRVRTNSAGDAVLDYAMDRRDREALTVGLIEAARIQRAAGALQVGSLHNRGYTAGDGVHEIGSAEFASFTESLRRAGIRENAVGLFSAHPTGSLAVDSDRSNAAVDPRGAVYGCSGLWVADGSLMPTAPGVNPMISIMALADRTAGFLLDELGGRPGGTKG